MTMSNYPGGFADGILVRGIPLTQTHVGEVFWVAPTSGELTGQRTASNGNNGSFNAPFSTLDYAIDQCLASRGDIIFVKPGYSQTIANATTTLFDKAGIAIVGLGVGTMRPTLSFITDTAANIPISAANMSIQNFLFTADFNDVASVFTVTTGALASDFTVEHCEFRDTSSSLSFTTILTDNATAQNLAGLYFANNRVISLDLATGTTAIKLTGAAQDRVRIIDNFFMYPALSNTAAILAKGANVTRMLEIARNIVFRPSTDTATGGIILTTTSTTDTGMVYDNYCKTLDVAGMLVCTTLKKLGYVNNLLSGSADTSGIVIPAIDAD